MHSWGFILGGFICWWVCSSQGREVNWCIAPQHYNMLYLYRAIICSVVPPVSFPVLSTAAAAVTEFFWLSVFFKSARLQVNPFSVNKRTCSSFQRYAPELCAKVRTNFTWCSQGFGRALFKMHMLTLINSVIQQVSQGYYSYRIYHLYWTELDMFIIKICLD